MTAGRSRLETGFKRGLNAREMAWFRVQTFTKLGTIHFLAFFLLTHRLFTGGAGSGTSKDGNRSSGYLTKHGIARTIASPPLGA